MRLISDLEKAQESLNGALYISSCVTDIGYRCCYECTGLEKVVFPAETRTIEMQSFKNCTGLKTIKLNNGIMTIRKEAFYGCSNLEDVTIPSTVTMIEKDAFSGCPKSGIVKTLEITSLPHKNKYTLDETLNLSGIQVSLIYNENIKIDVTDECVFSPADNTTLSDVGSQTVTITYQDADETLTETFDISVIGNIIVPSYYGSLTFNGTIQSPAWNPYPESVITVSGDTSAYNAGDYSTTFTLADDYEWEDGTNTPKTIAWSIATRVITVPSVTDKSLTYNSTEQGPTISSYETDFVTTSGTFKATSPGSYSIMFELNDNVNCVWSDGTVNDIIVPWTIDKADGVLVLSSYEAAVTGKQKTVSIIVEQLSGDITVSSSDSAIATASIRGSEISISYGSVMNGGVATVTVNVAENANYKAKTVTIAVTVNMISKVLNENDWYIIRDVAEQGTGANYWNVGDRKEITLNGTLDDSNGGSRTFDNYKIYAFIIGFNHNQSIEGTAIHFQIGFTSLTGGNKITLGNFRRGAGYGDYYWCNQELRTVIVPQLINCFPAELQNVLKEIPKYSFVDGMLAPCNDKVFLLATYEVFGETYHAQGGENNYLKQYAYYANGNSAVFYDGMNPSSVVGDWWLRGYYATGSTGVLNSDVYQYQGVAQPSASRADIYEGFAPGFAVGV